MLVELAGAQSQKVGSQFLQCFNFFSGDIGAFVPACRDAGSDDGEILEVNLVCVYFNYSNRLLNGLGVTTEGDTIGYYKEPPAPPDVKLRSMTWARRGIDPVRLRMGASGQPQSCANSCLTEAVVSPQLSVTSSRTLASASPECSSSNHSRLRSLMRSR